MRKRQFIDAVFCWQRTYVLIIWKYYHMWNRKRVYWRECSVMYVWKKLTERNGDVFIMKEKEFQKIVKKERLQMKKKLFRWGRTLDFCQRKQREIDKLQKMVKQFFILGKNAPFWGEEDVTLEEAKQLYEKEITKIVQMICENLTFWCKVLIENDNCWEKILHI